LSIVSSAIRFPVGMLNIPRTRLAPPCRRNSITADGKHRPVSKAHRILDSVDVVLSSMSVTAALPLYVSWMSAGEPNFYIRNGSSGASFGSTPPSEAYRKPIRTVPRGSISSPSRASSDLRQHPALRRGEPSSPRDPFWPIPSELVKVIH